VGLGRGRIGAAGQQSLPPALMPCREKPALPWEHLVGSIQSRSYRLNDLSPARGERLFWDSQECPGPLGACQPPGPAW